jgi:hypothetical protein
VLRFRLKIITSIPISRVQSAGALSRRRTPRDLALWPAAPSVLQAFYEEICMTF